MGCPGVVYADKVADKLIEDEAVIDEALDVMPAIYMDTLRDIKLIDSLVVAIEPMLVRDVDWFIYEALPVHEPYSV